jgi:dTMP kinase
MVEELQKGNFIILDRYAYSGVAFTSAKGLDYEWCKNSDRGLPRPDMVFFL